MATTACKNRGERAKESLSGRMGVRRRGQRQRRERNQGLMEEGKWALPSYTHRCSTSASRRRRGPWREFPAWLSSWGACCSRRQGDATRWREKRGWHSSLGKEDMSLFDDVQGVKVKDGHSVKQISFDD